MESDFYSVSESQFSKYWSGHLSRLENKPRYLNKFCFRSEPLKWSNDWHKSWSISNCSERHLRLLASFKWSNLTIWKYFSMCLCLWAVIVLKTARLVLSGGRFLFKPLLMLSQLFVVLSGSECPSNWVLWFQSEKF